MNSWNYHITTPSSVFETEIMVKWEDMDDFTKKHRKPVYDGGQIFLKRYIEGKMILHTLPCVSRMDCMPDIPIGDIPAMTDIPCHSGFWRNVGFYLQRYYHLFEIPDDEQFQCMNNQLDFFAMMNEARFADDHLQLVMQRDGKLPDLPPHMCRPAQDE